MKLSILKLLPLATALLIALSGCSANRSDPSNSPAQRSSPSQIKSSADVVKASAANVSVAAGSSTDAVITLSISSGFHVNANPATFDYLIATAVTPGKAEGINAGKPAYPASQKKKFQFAEEPLAVYEGDVQVKLPIGTDPGTAKGARAMPLDVRVQACDHEQCFPPSTLHTSISVDVK
jgi:hypothetical protein